MIFINRNKIESFIFPGGEVNVKVSHEDCEVYIRASLNSSNDIMELMLVANALKHNNCKIQALHIPYIPYARQDRVCNKGEALSIKVFSDLINSINSNMVVGWDVHSNVTSALINNFINWPPQRFIVRNKDLFNILKDKKTLICSPDAGAKKKVYEVAKIFCNDWIITGNKVRNIETGEITSTEVDVGYLKGENIVIIDDICDGGKTFIELAKVLKNKGAGKIYLYVTHGIFSKGMNVFDDLIDKIWTTDSICNKIHKKLNIIGG